MLHLRPVTPYINHILIGVTVTKLASIKKCVQVKYHINISQSTGTSIEAKASCYFQPSHLVQNYIDLNLLQLAIAEDVNFTITSNEQFEWTLSVFENSHMAESSMEWTQLETDFSDSGSLETSPQVWASISSFLHSYDEH